MTANERLTPTRVYTVNATPDRAALAEEILGYFEYPDMPADTPDGAVAAACYALNAAEPFDDLEEYGFVADDAMTDEQLARAFDVLLDIRNERKAAG